MAEPKQIPTYHYETKLVSNYASVQFTTDVSAWLTTLHQDIRCSDIKVMYSTYYHGFTNNAVFTALITYRIQN